MDDFKQINDIYGHAAGDTILHELGVLLLGHIRGDDAACHYSGDEFIIILPGSSRAATRERVKQIRKYAKQLHPQLKGRTLDAVTLSLGLAILPEDGAMSAIILRAVGKCFENGWVNLLV